jgi:preprotein translocase subunit SecY
MLKKFILAAILIFTLSFQASADSASDIIGRRPPDSLPSLDDGSGGLDAESKANYLIFSIIDIILVLAGILAVFFITMAGVRLTVSSGSQDQIDGAKRMLMWSILGLLAVILSWAIVTNVVNIVFTKDESPSSECRHTGCVCLSDSDCDSGNCDDEPNEPPLDIGEICQPANL